MSKQQDFNGDGHYDLLWKSTAGDLVIWNMSTDGHRVIGSTFLSGQGGPLTTAADLNGDGTMDLLWNNAVQWSIKNNAVASVSVFTSVEVRNPVPSGALLGVGDFTGDGKDDMLMLGQAQAADTYGIHVMNGASTTTILTFANPGSFWKVDHVADFNGDNYADILWRGQDGRPAIWLMQNNQIIGSSSLPNFGDTWRIIGTGDFNNDGKDDLMWQSSSGTLSEWLMDGAYPMALGAQIYNTSSEWSIVA